VTLYYTNDQTFTDRGENCHVMNEVGVALQSNFEPGSGYLKGSDVGVQMTKWSGEAGAGTIDGEITHSSSRLRETLS
jgi:hypothetical protein